MCRIIFIAGMLLLVSAFEGRAQDLTGGQQSLSKTIRIYPNPTNQASEFVNVKVSPLKSDMVKLSLHNIIGNEIRTETEIVDEHELRMRIKELSAGYYIITVKDEVSNFRVAYKLLIR